MSSSTNIIDAPSPPLIDPEYKRETSMEIRIDEWCSFKLIFLLSLVALAVQTGAQDNIFSPLSGATNSGGKTGRTFKASAADAASGYTYSVLYSFCAASNCTDGAAPQAGLIQNAAGNLYSTTTAGGANSNSACGSNGCGTVFKLDDMGHETVAYSFCSAPNCADGATPQAGLIQDAAGNLYSTAAVGGANGRGGVVFKLTPPIFIITGTPVNMSPGSTTTSTITVSPGATFTGSVVLTAAITSSPAGAQDPPTLSFGSTSAVSITDASGATASLSSRGDCEASERRKRQVQGCPLCRSCCTMGWAETRGR